MLVSDRGVAYIVFDISLTFSSFEYIFALVGPGSGIGSNTSSVFSTYAITEPSPASDISQLSTAVSGTMLSFFVIILVIFDL